MPRPRSERRSTWPAVVLASVPAIYVLSFGPWCWFARRFELSRYPWVGDASSFFYRPLIWLADIPPFGAAMEWYLRLWLPDF